MFATASERKQEHWCTPLYREKAAELLLYGRSLGLSHWEAEDVLQETFVSLLQRVEAPQEPLYFCLRSYRNRAMNYRRGIWRRIRRELESRHWFDKAEARDEREQAAMTVLETLPAEQREAIVLKVWHHLTFAQVAELLSVSPHTVAGRYRYGMQKLRTALEGIDYEQMESDRERDAPVASASALPVA